MSLCEIQCYDNSLSLSIASTQATPRCGAGALRHKSCRTIVHCVNGEATNQLREKGCCFVTQTFQLQSNCELVGNRTSGQVAALLRRLDANNSWLDT